MAAALCRTFISRPPLRVGARCFAVGRPKPGLLELTEAEVQPGQLQEYLPTLRKSLADSQHAGLPAPLGVWTTDIGLSLGRVYVLRNWADYNARDAAAHISPCLGPCQVLRSSIFAEATAALDAAGLETGLLDFEAPGSIGGPVAYELRTYELKLGYATVPTFLELYTNGLKDKFEADRSGQSMLVSLIYSEAGAAPLNTVHELWRHTSLQGSQTSREASRAAKGWRKAVGEIAELATSFRTQYLRPVPGIGRLQ
eukprot:TRINITY_DN44939_c0_g1_i1.p1 TRINITY_DN44939_c0_g1~~TRINITY_DN44939_c0_g1_i1.p1  ORF type:complete len:255 (-),score=30.87 TRINITY_DN44939_c0_g1_i1:103-867(-)